MDLNLNLNLATEDRPLLPKAWLTQETERATEGQRERERERERESESE